jgi:hypothetical protein
MALGSLRQSRAAKGNRFLSVKVRLRRTDFFLRRPLQSLSLIIYNFKLVIPEICTYGVYKRGCFNSQECYILIK